MIVYSYRQGAYNSESFKVFILQHLVPHFRSNPTYVLIMGNAQFHKSSAILDLLRLNNIVFKFLVPYSPELNPIEEFFSAIKSRFNALRVAEPLLTIDRCIDRLLNTTENYGSICGDLYNHMREWLEKARRREHFI